MKQKNLVYYGLPLIGTLLCLWYVREATCNVVYTDYIRLVNSYLPDVWNPDKFFVPDILTRIPIHYLGRIVNILLFNYSTMFDMALGVMGLGLSGFVLADYCRRRQVNMCWYLFLVFVLFGLNKWEMLTNGTGWGHFLAFACFYYHYVVFDRVVCGDGRTGDTARLLLLPTAITLTVAGPYCAVYAVLMLLFYGGVAMQARKQTVGKKTAGYWLTCCVGVLIPLFLYLWSNSYAVEDHAGAVDITLSEAVSGSLEFFPRFLLKSLASMTFGGETLKLWLEHGTVPDLFLYLLGASVAVGYGVAFYLNLRHRLYRKTLLPLMLLVAGAGNHGIILISRFIFLKENYGMSSRYALQYQVGILGIILTLGLLWKQVDSAMVKWTMLAVCLLILTGQVHTNYREWKMAPHREHYAENIAAVALRFEEESDEVLRKTFDYRREEPDSGRKVRAALTILKENGWNVFAR